MSVVLLGPDRTRVETRKTRSIRIRHRTARFGVKVVPVNSKPRMGLKRKCPTCQIPHMVKNLHLPLDASGGCLVSEGVLADLKLVPDMGDFDFVADIVNPPPITITGNRLGVDQPDKQRLAVDQANNHIRIWKEPVIV